MLTMMRGIFETSLGAVRRLLPKGRLARGVTVLAGGNMASQLISIAAMPLLTRLYSPTDYGLMGVYNSLLGLLVIVAAGRYELAIPLPKRDRSAIDIVLLSLLIVLSASLVCGVAVYWFGDSIVNLTDSKGLRPYLWLLPFSMFGGGTYQILNYWGTRRKIYRRLVHTRLNQSISGALVGIAVGTVHSGVLGLLLSAIVAQTAGISTLAGDACGMARKMRYRVSRFRLRHIAHVYRQFPMYACVAGLFNSAGLTLPSLLISGFNGPQFAGWFVLALRVTSMPMNLVGLAVSKVFLAESAPIMHNSPDQLLPFFNRVTVRLLPICFVVAAIGLVSPLAFGFVFGQNFATAGIYAAFLAISCGAQLIVSPISTVAILKKRQDIQLALDVTRLLGVVGSLCIPWLLGAAAIVAVATFATVMALLYLLYFITYRHLAHCPVARMPSNLNGTT